MPDPACITTAVADRYIIQREPGQGGMATGYLARDLKHDREGGGDIWLLEGIE